MPADAAARPCTEARCRSTQDSLPWLKQWFSKAVAMQAQPHSALLAEALSFSKQPSVSSTLHKQSTSRPLCFHMPPQAIQHNDKTAALHM